MSWTGTNPVTIGNATKKSDYDKLWDNALYLMSPYTAAGDMGYATAANTLARLAAVANKTLHCNNAGTAPEWSSRFKVGSFTHDTAVEAAEAVTGVGFYPQIVILFFGLSAGYIDLAIDDGAACKSVSMFLGPDASDFYVALSGSVYAKGHITARGSDGFTITWSKSGSPTGTKTIFYAAIG